MHEVRLAVGTDTCSLQMESLVNLLAKVLQISTQNVQTFGGLSVSHTWTS